MLRQLSGRSLQRNVSQYGLRWTTSSSNATVTAPHALAGIRVLDLSRVLAGPYCTMMLGDLGADVIKVEQPGKGDDTRRWGPPFVGGESAYFLCANRNKRSIAVDLSQKEGREIILNLAVQSDIFVENFLTGKLKQLGLGFDEVKAVNPGIVYCSITGFGQTGPYCERGGYDLAIQALGGFMHITSLPTGERCKIALAISDLLTGLNAHGAILAALYFRDRCGGGRGVGGAQHLDVSLLDSTVAALANVGSNWLVANQEAVPLGTAHASICPYQAFDTADEPVVIAVGNDKQFQSLCHVLGAPELALDERFQMNTARVIHRDVLIPIITGLLKQHGRQHWMPLFTEQEIPHGPINTIKQVFSDPHVIHRQMIQTIQHSVAGTVQLAGPAVKYGATPAAVRLPPPTLGEHTHEILQSVLGYSNKTIENLLRSKSVM